MDTASEEVFENALDKIRELSKSNAALLKIKKAAKLYLEHGEPELADDLESLLADYEAKEK